MKAYESIITGLTEAVDYEKGKRKARVQNCTVAPVPTFSAEEIKDLRTSLNMTQNTFAAVMGVSAKTVEAWEAGTNAPLGTARRMLGILKADNSILQRFEILS